MQAYDSNSAFNVESTEFTVAYAELSHSWNKKDQTQTILRERQRRQKWMWNRVRDILILLQYSINRHICMNLHVALHAAHDPIILVA